MNHPDPERVLRPLKGFQRRTVDHAFHRLFTANDSTARFLVADEVGLGKTLVARGVIARTIAHLWESVGRIDIIYICSNAGIARANLPKLRVDAGTHQSFELATRLTMLATALAPQEGQPGLADAKLNFVSFTPGTSFNMGRSTGQWGERQVLFQLLEPFAPTRTPLMNLLQCGIRRRDAWRWWLRHRRVPVEPGIRSKFRSHFEQSDLRERLPELLRAFDDDGTEWPWEARWKRDRFIAGCRRLLARKCVDALEPDLVIVDEFQRFRSLLETRTDRQDPGAELAQALFRAKTPEGNPVRTLLLSATPYKLYTADAEIGHEDHYLDFLETSRFLLAGDESRVEDLKSRLARFGAALRRVSTGSGVETDAVPAKGAVEEALRRIMSRTERVAASAERDAMVREKRRLGALAPTDVGQYLAADALFRAVGEPDPMRFWKSAPYLPHFMSGYRFNERLRDAIETEPEPVAEVLGRHDSAFLAAGSVHGWEELAAANPRLRDLVGCLLEGGDWRLLWIPPTLPYWPLEGPFAGRKAVTKTLVFSAWNVVPDVLSAVLSYEAERRMVEKAPSVRHYENPARQQRPLLRFSQADDGLHSHRLLWLLLPCLPLADDAHPLEAPAGENRREWVRRRVEAMLRRLPNPTDGEVDPRWEWALPLLLDPGLRGFVQTWRAADDDQELLRKPNPRALDAHLDDVLALPETLGRRPSHLAELATEAALGSPAVLAARCLLMPAEGRDDVGPGRGLEEGARRELSVAVAHAFWRLFNRPAVISLLRAAGAGADEGAYWRQVLRYCRQGNLQAVLDEHWHLLWEQESFSEESLRETAERCARTIAEAVAPSPARVHARFFEAQPGNEIRQEEIRIRAVFAQRFGRLRSEQGAAISQDAVRRAFNSPFRPFLLASTSIGQEGLDFHPWCHRVLHWNLPGNPVDLEQREGRVHRYKGHAVRRNVAEAHAGDGLAAWARGEDLWAGMFRLADRAARSRGDKELVPFWIAPGDSRVERIVPLLPYTQDVEAFERLKQQLAAYRVVLGQPRQEELLTLLNRAGLDEARLREWAVDLSPPG